jgi:single-strand DNA-binding protein
MSGFSINHVVLTGGLTRDPDLRSTQSGMPVCSLRIANNRRRKDSSGDWVDVPGYFSVTVWGGMGEWVANNLGKGDQVTVDGELTWREWQDKDGNKRESVEINCNSIVPRNGDGGGGGGQRQSRDGGSGFAPHTDVPADANDFAPQQQTRGSGGLPPRQSQPADDDIPF